ncbi:MAG: FAA hydrolase family protein [Deltaproteobacteria bacterium]|nr:MAG: FAA hydrolase family protein [Deltaproteobacteria bacterium]
MKLLTFRRRGEGISRIGALTLQGEVVDLSSAHTSYLHEKEEASSKHLAITSLPSDMAEFIRGGQASLKAAEMALTYVQEKKDQKMTLGPNVEKWVMSQEEVEFLPPILHPGKMISAGMNYQEHLADSGSDAPEMPVAFSKFYSSLVGHHGKIYYTDQTTTLDYEIELAFVIGKKGKYIKRDEAMDYVYGYTIFNDVSERTLQFREMKQGLLLGGKNMDTFGPLGPWIVTKDEIEDPHNLRMILKVNGEIRQDSNTKYMMFHICDQIAYWSSLMSLHPGDLFATGTPSGVALGRKPHPELYYLKPGDRIEASIEGLGILMNQVVREPKDK